ncbi:MAG: SPOR domain-containing protein [Pseudomonadota bacterium]
MGADEGSGGYGFARRNNQVRKKFGKRPAARAGAPVIPPAPTSPSHKPAWVWLLIGFLIGAGGTLLTASFWLPAFQEPHIAMQETGDQSSQGDKLDRVATDPSVSKPESTSVTGLDIELPTTTADGIEPSPDLDDLDAAGADQAANVGTPDGETGSEGRPSTAAIGAGDDADERPLDGNLSTASPDQEQVVASLDLAISPIDVEEQSPESDDDRQQVEAPPSPVQTEAPVSEAARADPPIAAPPNDQPPSADAGPEVKEAKAKVQTSNSEPGRDLPPRIRQALQSARAKAAADRNDAGDGGSGRLYRVQLAAVDNEAAARIFWRKANERLPDVFTDVEPIFNQRLVGERLFFRIWVGAFDKLVDADNYCGWLKEQGQDCFVTRVDNL